MKTAIILIMISVVIFPAIIAAQSDGLIGMWADSEHCHSWIDPSPPYTTFNLWIFVLPGADGVEGLEFKMDLPANVILSGYELNPIFGITIDPITPWIAPGASWDFGPCQTDWFWTHRITLLTTDVLPSHITIVPHENSGLIASITCEDVQIEMDNYHFCVNEYCGLLTPYLPFLHWISLATHTMLVASFEPGLNGEDLVFISGSVQAEDYPEDLIEVTGSILHPSGDGSAILTLASPMTHGRTYRLNAYTCGRCDCGTTSIYFYFDETIASKKSTWGEIKSIYR